LPVTTIADAHHVIRHCKSRLLIKQDNKIVGVFPELFHLRPASDTRQQETYLSSVYYEFFEGDPVARMRSCCDAIPLKPKPKDGLVRLNVGRVKEQGQKVRKQLRVTHEGKAGSPAYAAIRGIPERPDDELSSLLATLAIIETIEVSLISTGRSR
jgi:hypothetical protein